MSKRTSKPVKAEPVKAEPASKPAKKTAKRKKRQVWQTHHLTYASDAPTPERTVKVTRGEHWVITQLARFKSLSHGAVQALCHEIGRKELRETE